MNLASRSMMNVRSRGLKQSPRFRPHLSLSAGDRHYGLECAMGYIRRALPRGMMNGMPDRPTSEQIRREAEKLRETAVDLMSMRPCSSKNLPIWRGVY